MKMVTKSMLFIAAFFMAVSAYAIDCSFKVINHSNTTFEDMQIKGTIGNLYLSLCTKNPRMNDDEKSKINCSENPKNTLYTHPVYPKTCESTSGWPVYIQFEGSEKTCYSKTIDSRVDRDVVLNYPEDFNCSN